METLEGTFTEPTELQQQQQQPSVSALPLLAAADESQHPHCSIFAVSEFQQSI